MTPLTADSVGPCDYLEAILEQHQHRQLTGATAASRPPLSATQQQIYCFPLAYTSFFWLWFVFISHAPAYVTEPPCAMPPTSP